MCFVKVSVWFLLLFGRDTNPSTSEGCHSYSVSIRPVSGLVLDLDLQLDHDKVEGIKPFYRRCVQDLHTMPRDQFLGRIKLEHSKLIGNTSKTRLSCHPACISSGLTGDLSN